MPYHNAPDKQTTITRWIQNGMSLSDAEQLHSDMVNDPAYPDPDAITYEDPSINDRLKQAESKKR
ncbi:hypothetical protein [Vibrio celticus]|uniref:Uncharacterized protein n=1 Tax=Vibrio celticus TaxID=446372 RepID=A0A1C3JA56_9VIBR|nr:hypothetical protein [Vibrio celticus]SBT11936.1 hypothetical protein VCE7224_00670 [Vibrio celticus]